MSPRLVFIHGWGFDASFWDPLASLLSQFPQTRIDLGFFGAAEKPVEDSSSSILIGHSLGFVHGLRKHQNWRGWVAINGFPRFLGIQEYAGCTTPAALRDMRVRLQGDPEKTVRSFHELLGSRMPSDAMNIDRLRSGLDELRDADVGPILSSLAAPGLVLASRNDPLVPLAVSEGLNQWARGGGLLMHERGSHILPYAEPAWCAEAIAGFVKRNF